MGIFEKIAEFFKKEEHVIMPAEEPRKVEKKFKVLIVRNPKNLENLREVLSYDLVFFDISSFLSRSELRAFVEKLRFYCEDSGAKLLGLSSKWLFITKFEVEKN